MGTAKVDFVVKTSGDGFWSNSAVDVRITRLEWHTIDTEGDLGAETFVNVTFDPKTWDVSKQGLIYTDKGFREGLREKLMELVARDQLPKQLPWQDIDYTEQGMQHAKYVHMILGSW